MASSSPAAAAINPEDLASFTTHLKASNRILALLGAGLSASSGLPTFRGAGGLWRTHDATSLATPEAFDFDPGLVWQFYSYRRHMALNAKPNPAHYALAELAKRNPNFVTISQNVDGLSPRAGHPAEQLKLIHGNLFTIRCSDEDRCGYRRENDFTDPIVPALALPPEDIAAAEESIKDKTGKVIPSPMLQAAIAKKNALIKGKDIADINVPIPDVSREELPHCPKCKHELLRPGVVWFGESLPTSTMSEIDRFIHTAEPIDLMLVIGTSSVVYPAAGYTQIARAKGARVAVINPDPNDARGLTKRDWFFQGDAAAIVPELLKSVIGELDVGKLERDETEKREASMGREKNAAL